MSQEPASGWTERLRQLRDCLGIGLVERDESIRLALLAALAGEHVLLIGDPGTAKSLVARRLHLAFRGEGYFERLLTRFSVPEELFGPLSIRGLEEDRYERLVEGYLPAATVAFLDEIFKANSAILNSLLTLLNEREFDNGSKRVRTPLVAVIGASNELPQEAELDALFDRFLVRFQVSSVTKDGFRQLLQLRGDVQPNVAEELRLSPADIEGIRRSSQGIELGGDVEALLQELREWCAAEKVKVSDRRWRKIVRLLQVSALTNGRSRVSVWDCWILQHCVWNRPEDRVRVYEWYADRVGASEVMDTSRLTQVVSAMEGQLEHDRVRQVQCEDGEGRPLFVGEHGVATTQSKELRQKLRDGKPLYLAPERTAKEYDYYRKPPFLPRNNDGMGFTRQELDSLYVYRGSEIYEFKNWKEREKYLGDATNWIQEDSELPPLMEPMRHKSLYVAHVSREVQDLIGEVKLYLDKLEAHMGDLDADIQSHLWINHDFAPIARASLDRTKRSVENLLIRAERVHDGFASLPIELRRPVERAQASTTSEPRARAKGARSK